jgi:26S proteasome regulatory subunit N6
MGRLEDAQELAKTDLPKAEAIYKEILSTPPGMNDAALRDYELALMELGGLYRDKRFVRIWGCI